MWYKDEYYGWNAVYLISGLCRENFLYDPVGSMQHFEDCMQKELKTNEKHT